MLKKQTGAKSHHEPRWQSPRPHQRGGRTMLPGTQSPHHHQKENSTDPTSEEQASNSKSWAETSASSHPPNLYSRAPKRCSFAGNAKNGRKGSSQRWCKTHTAWYECRRKLFPGNACLLIPTLQRILLCLTSMKVLVKWLFMSTMCENSLKLIC